MRGRGQHVTVADDVHDLGAVIRTRLGVVTAQLLADLFLCQLALTRLIDTSA